MNWNCNAKMHAHIYMHTNNVGQTVYIKLKYKLNNALKIHARLYYAKHQEM